MVGILSTSICPFLDYHWLYDNVPYSRICIPYKTDDCSQWNHQKYLHLAFSLTKDTYESWEEIRQYNGKVSKYVTFYIFIIFIGCKEHLQNLS